MFRNKKELPLDSRSGGQLGSSKIPTRMESCVSPVRPVWGSVDPRTCVWAPGVPRVVCRAHSIELWPYLEYFPCCLAAL